MKDTGSDSRNILAVNQPQQEAIDEQTYEQRTVVPIIACLTVSLATTFLGLFQFFEEKPSKEWVSTFGIASLFLLTGILMHCMHWPMSRRPMPDAPKESLYIPKPRRTRRRSNHDLTDLI